jgi:hypothetical protein
MKTIYHTVKTEKKKEPTALKVAILILLAICTVAAYIDTVQTVQKKEQVQKVSNTLGGLLPTVPVAHASGDKLQALEVGSKYSKIKEYVNSYPNSQITDTYLDILHDECDDKTLQTVIAISVAECGMGKACSTKNNFWGWHKNGDTSYDPDRETMAKEICEGIGTYYSDIGGDSDLIELYTGGDRSSTWSKNFQIAYNQMN